MTPAGRILILLALGGALALPSPARSQIIDALDGRWSMAPPSSPARSPFRPGCASTFDAEYHEILFSGGSWNGSPLTGTWGRAFADTDPWIDLSSILPLPSPGAGGSMALLDPFSLLLLIPGETGKPLTREYQVAVVYPDPLAVALRFPERRLSTWVASLPDSFTPRVRAAICAPPASGAAYLFGGRGATGPGFGATPEFFDDLWLCDELRWSRVPARGEVPPRRCGATLVCDALRRRLLLFGGESPAGTGTVVLGDTWAYSLADSTWTRLDAGGPRRTRHAAFYDPIRNRMVVFGGSDSTRTVRSDVWALDLAGGHGWRLLAPAGPVPPPMPEPAAAYDPTSDRFLVFGGASNSGLLGPEGETWFLDFGQTAVPRVDCNVPARALPAGSFVFHADVASLLDPGFRALLFVTRTSAPNWTWVLTARSFPDGTRSADFTFDVAESASGPDTLQAGVFFPLVPTGRVPCQCVLQVPRLVTAARAMPDPGGARLEWDTDEPAMSAANVERRVDEGDWSVIGGVQGGAGLLRFFDADVDSDHVYDYRLTLEVEGHSIHRGTVHFDFASTLPAGPGFALAGLRPNPARAAQGVIAYELPDAAPAALEMFDLRGRRILRQEVGGVPAGPRQVGIPPDVPPGLYFIRLSHGGRRIVRRACILE